MHQQILPNPFQKLSEDNGLILRITALDDQCILVLKNRPAPHYDRVWYKFTIHTKTWTKLPDLPAKQTRIGFVPNIIKHCDHVYITVVYSALTFWRIKYQNGEFLSGWEQVPKVELSIYGFAMISDNTSQRIYFSGGYSYNDTYDDRITKKSLAYVDTQQTWNWKYTNMEAPMKRRDHKAIKVQDEIYLFGGFGYSDANESLGHIYKVHVFNIKTGKWRTATNIPSDKNTKELSISVVHDRWIIFTNRKGVDAFFVLDTRSNLWYSGGGKHGFSFLQGYDHLKMVSLNDSIVFVLRQEEEPQQNIFYSMPYQWLHPWIAVGDIVSLQQLVFHGRAAPKKISNSSSPSSDQVKNDLIVIQKLILDLNDDLFRTTLSFLIYKSNSRIVTQ